ncbi:hypothetical protein OZN62_03640 [Aurantiacibacter sp. MUD11]|uniref:hypothetical protein n=1 Tax=Aurantiacibacter sp. MUD11 TaxID=3003265 RepID=UPI0022AB2387|nr:hypothetical protein [Aurantiacibacter sp. MUD11]WAT18680.1 hypothetical protein OZN62_03640 [Aurantiacibacter sp. MUD11]
MGHATSSAVRADDAAQADAFGSLSTLGGPKKFKKKPVLVLAPEELEKAHSMFQDASAELLGQPVERPARPASSLLGLAPMDDESASPEDMGEVDDAQNGGDDGDIVTNDDVLGMSRIREAEEPTIADLPELPDEHLDIDAMAAQALDQDLDMEHRIFPSLPTQPEEEFAEQDEAFEAGPESEADAEPELAVGPAYFDEPEAEDFVTPEPVDEEAPAEETEAEVEPMPEATGWEAEEFAGEAPAVENAFEAEEYDTTEAEAADFDEPAELEHAELDQFAEDEVVDEEADLAESADDKPARSKPSALDRVVLRVPPAPYQPPAGDPLVPVGQRAAKPESLETPDAFRAPRIEDAPEARPASRYIAPFDDNRAAFGRHAPIAPDFDDAFDDEPEAETFDPLAAMRDAVTPPAPVEPEEAEAMGEEESFSDEPTIEDSLPEAPEELATEAGFAEEAETEQDFIEEPEAEDTFTAEADSEEALAELPEDEEPAPVAVEAAEVEEVEEAEAEAVEPEVAGPDFDEPLAETPPVDDWQEQFDAVPEPGFASLVEPERAAAQEPLELGMYDEIEAEDELAEGEAEKFATGNVEWPETEVEAEAEPETAAEPVVEEVEQPAEAETRFTEIEDDEVDGYAFMYADVSRERTLDSVSSGQSNSLRQKLIRERQQEAAEARERARSQSLAGKFVAWLRGLFG